MVNRHLLFPNNFSVDQAKNHWPAIIQNTRPPFPKIHAGLTLWELNVNRKSGMASSINALNRYRACYVGC